MLTTKNFELLKIKKFNGDWLSLQEVTSQNLGLTMPDSNEALEVCQVYQSQLKVRFALTKG